jgi:uncharacterized protein YndB with AHSA1/START domain
MRTQRSINLDVPPEKIWPFLTKPDNILKWCITFRKFEYTTKQHTGTGTTFYVEEKAGGPLMKLNFEITEWAENQKIVFKMTSGTFVKDYEQWWTIEPVLHGCRFSFAENVEMPWGIFGRLIGLLGRPSAEQHAKEMLNKLKILAES